MAEEKSLAQRHESGCAMMRRLVAQERQHIARLERRLEVVRADLVAEQGRPEPDPDRIASLESQITALEEDSEQSRRTIDELESVIAENC